MVGQVGVVGQNGSPMAIPMADAWCTMYDNTARANSKGLRSTPTRPTSPTIILGKDGNDAVESVFIPIFRALVINTPVFGYPLPYPKRRESHAWRLLTCPCVARVGRVLRVSRMKLHGRRGV